ncbi:short-chain dehydrogenase [Asticcacaulis sp. AC460]|uniref:glucose 1-dehydrogenase n=1 Tax=Asticcacaulis sp. AC460 TaxID=1282360 RepID=UPI0003C3F9B8|nr:glucose 1-dehydrogenase [Asticcacaulis sp. AC460]ESQ87225.1 short-chain dehydrogenase [Asticcacaulis sp. AC460]
MNRLSRKVCLITGAASGIGAAMARAFAAEDATVIISDINAAKGEAAAAAMGGKGFFLRHDVTDEAQWQSVMAAIAEQHGGLDVLVNNAGIIGTEGGADHDPEHTSLDEWHRVMRINLDSVFLGCKHAIAAMRATGRGGSIINMSSRSGLVGVPKTAAYAASKAAIRNHSKSVALYCAEENLGIRCNSLYPASIRTPMWDAMIDSREDEQAMIDAMPLHRFGRPEEVAAVAILLASDEATYITGSEFNIDGGILAGTSTSPK